MRVLLSQAQSVVYILHDYPAGDKGVRRGLRGLLPAALEEGLRQKPLVLLPGGGPLGVIPQQF